MTFHRYVALGDSFTEGVGDPDPSAPTACAAGPTASPRCSATQTDDFGYANLAIRGRKLAPIVAEQLEPALALRARPRHDPRRRQRHPAAARRHRRPRSRRTTTAIARLLGHRRARGRCSPSSTPGRPGIYAAMRGRFAIFNEWVREIADRHDVTLVDMWRMRDTEICRRHGHRPDAPQRRRRHQHMARAVLDALGVEHDLRTASRSTRARCSAAATQRSRQRALDARVPRALGPPPRHRALLGRRLSPPSGRRWRRSTDRLRRRSAYRSGPSGGILRM